MSSIWWLNLKCKFKRHLKFHLNKAEVSKSILNGNYTEARSVKLSDADLLGIPYFPVSTRGQSKKIEADQLSSPASVALNPPILNGMDKETSTYNPSYNTPAPISSHHIISSFYILDKKDYPTEKWYIGAQLKEISNFLGSYDILTFNQIQEVKSTLDQMSDLLHLKKFNYLYSK